ncbi:aldo/keto reductase [Breznakia pachnodae]|uniref:Diketogulonate reductase-like aldo/keto reductase n=1 Tax=Breznakia pachnodae TaxID=265178 RepID=A0ABU0E7Q9_9FIRM|nr:aldo/keto reductase [Breznakia pachnodae]MDQ0362751.1 diketogulonate reductase-like aldo/keto reductase [Breznakia pachnodae]
MNKLDKKIMNDGKEIPTIALGVWRSGDDTKNAVLTALEAGYRHIDTASVYKNEEAVGEAIKESGIPREEIFVTTKLWNEDIQSGEVKKALEESLKKLGLDYVDLYLIHWPIEGYKEAYLEMEKLQSEGLIRSIGVSNFKVHHMKALLEVANVKPAVNQMEFSPLMQDNDILNYCNDNHIVLEAWSPLGSGSCLSIPEIQDLATKYSKSTAQIILRWLYQKGIVILPKSVHKNRILENKAIFDFTLTIDDISIMDGLNQDKRVGPDPDRYKP